ncbi:exonuclease domain-containing protein [Pedobacter sp. WC2423]|uniref:exonuclease domain-containing protein n=1 Tax=Pedobacter sp. WC2423 TaxID=3234142 RepID=UPI003466510D
MKLNLIRPLAFFDLETTGINVGSDRIVEIAILKAMPDGSELVKTLRIHPDMPIPLQSSLIHGIYDKDIADAPKFNEVAAEIAEFIGDADLAGYNSNRFDIPVLLEEFLRAGVDFDMTGRRFVDVQNVFHQMEQRTLRAAYKFYCDQDIINAHSAEADIKATYHVLLAQLDRYENVDFEDKQGNISQPVKNDVEALHAFTNMNKPVDFAGRMVFNENGEEVFNFGKHKNKTVEQVFDTEPSYYAWMKQGDFPLYTKKKLEEIWTRWNKKKELSRAAKIPATPRPAEAAGNPVKPKPAAAQPRPQQTGGQPRQPAPQPKKEKPAVNVTPDMLEQLKMKFGK